MKELLAIAVVCAGISMYYKHYKIKKYRNIKTDKKYKKVIIEPEIHINKDFVLEKVDKEKPKVKEKE